MLHCFRRALALMCLIAISACPLTVLGFQDDDAAATAEKVAEGEDVTAIKASIQSYVAAFNARDVEKLVAHWSPEGIYTSRTRGEQVVGREAMTAEFTAMFEGDNTPKLAVTTDSIEFISPNVALERGAATVTFGEDDIAETDYQVVYVKRDGQWLIDRVSEDVIVYEVNNYDYLKPLEWMIGEWVDSADGVTIELNCQWTRNQNFIACTYSVTEESGEGSSGLQVIGWDPKEQRIRSWLFDSDGSVINGFWSEKGGEWHVQSTATLADGGSGSFTTVLRPLDDGSFARRKINRVIDGQLLPNVEESIVQRR